MPRQIISQGGQSLTEFILRASSIERSVAMPLSIYNMFASGANVQQFLSMRIVKTVAAMQKLAGKWKSARRPIGFVPTMGYLHAGHISLVERARRCVGSRGQVVVSIYVNPTQFALTEDLSRYPRDFKRDQQLCRAAGVDVIFAPSNHEMYPERNGQSFSTYVSEDSLTGVMEGVSRPTHFRGVTTVVAKLFNIVRPDYAIFGAKDFQQAAVIQRMVDDLNIPLKLIVAPTRREPDGLAMSSRNKNLTPLERHQAVVLSQALKYARKKAGRIPIVASTLKSELNRMIASASEARVDYIEFFNAQTLQPVVKVKRGTHLALAVFFGRTRLIDNSVL